MAKQPTKADLEKQIKLLTESHERQLNEMRLQVATLTDQVEAEREAKMSNARTVEIIREDNLTIRTNFKSLQERYNSLQGENDKLSATVNLLSNPKTPNDLIKSILESLKKMPPAEARMVIEQVSAHYMQLLRDSLEFRRRQAKYLENNVVGMESWLERVAKDSVLAPNNAILG